MPEGIWDGLRQRRYLSLAQQLRIHLGDNNEEADLVASTRWRDAPKSQY